MNEWLRGGVTAAVTILAACSGGGERMDSAAPEAAETVALPELKDLNFGRTFELTDQDGERFDTASLKGKVMLLFFGYTTCPDACPMTLSKLARVDALLGEDADRVQTVFVSVDPERDTPERVKEYFSYYTLPVVGLTGTPEEIKSVAGDFGVYYGKSESETAAGYLVDHTTLVYLMDEEGRLRYLSHPEDRPEVLAGLIRKVLAEG